jgi:hypothetical protein
MLGFQAGQGKPGLLGSNPKNTMWPKGFALRPETL